MMLKLTRIGNSIGIILPDQLLAALRVKEGDQLELIERPEGILVRQYDPETDWQTEIVDCILHKHRGTLSVLSK